MRALLLSLALLAAPLAAQAPRELSEAQKARLKQSVTQDKASGQKAADEAMARQQQLARDQQAEAERARQQQQAAYEAAYDDAGPEPVQQSGGGAAAILNAFTGAFSSEYQKNMDVVNRGNAAVDYNRQQMIAEQQRQQRQRELAEQQERARQQAARQQAAQQQRMADQQRAANAASTSPAATAQRNADLQQQAAAERQRLAAERQIHQSATSRKCARQSGDHRRHRQRHGRAESGGYARRSRSGPCLVSGQRSPHLPVHGAAATLDVVGKDAGICTVRRRMHRRSGL
jgi:hypothetical protein